MSNIDELEIEASITINAEDCAGAIEIYCADYFVPPPKGIYSNTQVDCVMVDGGSYYTLTKGPNGVVRTPVTDLYKVKKGLSVYKEVQGTDVVVVSAMQLSNKEKCLSDLPIRPYRGMKIVDLLINNQINSFLAYRKGVKDLYTNIGGQFKHDLPSDLLEKNIGAISEQYGDIQRDIREFLNNKNWNIYFVKIKNYTVTIQRSMDWRAYEWCRRTQEGEWS